MKENGTYGRALETSISSINTGKIQLDTLMATCKLCDKSGWFLRTGKDGLCGDCEPIFAELVEQHVRIINQSLEIAKKTKKLDTLLSRVNLAIDNCKQLRQYEHRGIPTVNPPPSRFIIRLQNARGEAVRDWLESELVASRTKSQAATTPAAKTRPYTKLLESFNHIYSEIDDVSEFETIELKVRQEMDSIRLKLELDKAERLAFKGKKKGALEAYFDALYVLRKDSIPDEDQRVEENDIISKIRDLGGEVPG